MCIMLLNVINVLSIFGVIVIWSFKDILQYNSFLLLCEKILQLIAVYYINE